jgi:hypothetical protein
MRENCSYGSVGVPAGNRRPYPEERAQSCILQTRTQARRVFKTSVMRNAVSSHS